MTGIGGEPLAERDVVLGGEDGRGHEHGHLLAALDRFEHAAKRDFGLAVADVADDQAIHRPAGLHVELDLGRRPQLVQRFLVRERGLDLLLPRGVRRVSEAGRGGASGVDLEKLFGEVGDRALDPLLGAEPLRAAELGERRVLAARVAADAIDLLDRQEDLVGAGEAQLQVVALLTGGAAPEHPLIAGDAVVDVDDEIALGQPLQDVARNDASEGLGAANADGAEQLAVRDEHEAVGAAGEATVQAAADQRPRAAGRRLGQAIDDAGRQALLVQQVRKARRLVGRQDDTIAFGSPGLHDLGQTSGPSRRQRRLAPAEEIAHGSAAAGRCRRLGLPGQLKGSTPQQPALPFARPQIRLRPLVRKVAGRDQFVAPLGSLAPQEIGRVRDVARFVENHERVGRQMVQAGRGAQDRGPDLGRIAGLEGARRGADVVDVARVGAQLAGSGSHALLEAGQVGGESLRQFGAAGQAGDAVADLRDSFPGDQELTCGEQGHFFHRAQAALVRRIEDAHRVDLVAEQLDPDGHLRGRREDVDETAAPGELAPTGHLEHRLVAQRQQVVQQLVLVDAGPDSQAARLGRQLFRFEGVLQQRLDAGHQNASATRTPRRQGGHSSGCLVADQLTAFVGECGPRLENRHCIRVAQPGLELLGHAIADLGVASDPAEPLADECGCARRARGVADRHGGGEERLGPVRDGRQRGMPAAGGEWPVLGAEPLPQRPERAARVEQRRQDVEVRQLSGRGRGARPGRGLPGGTGRRSGGLGSGVGRPYLFVDMAPLAALAPADRAASGLAFHREIGVFDRRRVGQPRSVRPERVGLAAEPGFYLALEGATAREAHSATLGRFRLAPAGPGAPDSVGTGRSVDLTRRRRTIVVGRAQLKGVEVVRRLAGPVTRPGLDRVGRGIEQLRQPSLLATIELAQDVVDGVATRLADADT